MSEEPTMGLTSVVGPTTQQRCTKIHDLAPLCFPAVQPRTLPVFLSNGSGPVAPTRALHLGMGGASGASPLTFTQFSHSKRLPLSWDIWWRMRLDFQLKALGLVSLAFCRGP